jgi:hypothetical protein
MMRALNISCGIAVLFTSLAYAHLLHHYFINAPHEAHHDPISWSPSAPLRSLVCSPLSAVFDS